MGAKVGTAGAFNDLNLTPLIDVVLVVLIIMMVSMPIQVQEMGVKVPDPTPDEPPPPPPDEIPDQLVIALYADGKLALNRKLMTKERLTFELNRRLRSMAKKNVFIDADVTVPFEMVVDYVELARSANAEKVGLAKIKANGPQTYTSVDSGAMPRGVFIGTPLVNGVMTEKKADLAIQPAQKALEACYLAELARDSQLTGQARLTLLFNPDGQQYVDPSGEVKSPKVSSNDLPASPAFEPCLVDALKPVVAEPLGEGNTAAVTYTVLFSPG